MRTRDKSRYRMMMVNSHNNAIQYWYPVLASVYFFVSMLVVFIFFIKKISTTVSQTLGGVQFQ